jgi:hypothetical protein
VAEEEEEGIAMSLLVQRRRRKKKTALGTITEVLLPTELLLNSEPPPTPKPQPKPKQQKQVALHSNYLGDAPEATTSQKVTDFIDSDAFKTGAGAALIYHGYRRTGSLIWALLYGLAGRELPMLAVPVAIAQGFGKRRICTTE